VELIRAERRHEKRRLFSFANLIERQYAFVMGLERPLPLGKKYQAAMAPATVHSCTARTSCEEGDFITCKISLHIHG
jgi:hypothetical protein